MSDFAYFGSSITRASLGLPPLDLNDNVTYMLSNQILGGTMTWNRQVVKSPYVDGEYLVNAAKGSIQEQFGVQVLAPSQGALQLAIQALIDAFTQFSYVLTVQQDDAVYRFTCQPADYTVDWTQERMMARKALVTFHFNRLPVAVTS